MPSSQPVTVEVTRLSLRLTRWAALSFIPLTWAGRTMIREQASRWIQLAVPISLDPQDRRSPRLRLHFNKRWRHSIMVLLCQDRPANICQRLSRKALLWWGGDWHHEPREDCHGNQHGLQHTYD